MESRTEDTGFSTASILATSTPSMRTQGVSDVSRPLQATAHRIEEVGTVFKVQNHLFGSHLHIKTPAFEMNTSSGLTIAQVASLTNYTRTLVLWTLQACSVISLDILNVLDSANQSRKAPLGKCQESCLSGTLPEEKTIKKPEPLDSSKESISSPSAVAQELALDRDHASAGNVPMMHLPIPENDNSRIECLPTHQGIIDSNSYQENAMEVPPKWIVSWTQSHCLPERSKTSYTEATFNPWIVETGTDPSKSEVLEDFAPFTIPHSVTGDAGNEKNLLASAHTPLKDLFGPFEFESSTYENPFTPTQKLRRTSLTAHWETPCSLPQLHGSLMEEPLQEWCACEQVATTKGINTGTTEEELARIFLHDKTNSVKEVNSIEMMISIHQKSPISLRNRSNRTALPPMDTIAEEEEEETSLELQASNIDSKELLFSSLGSSLDTIVEEEEESFQKGTLHNHLGGRDVWKQSRGLEAVPMAKNTEFLPATVESKAPTTSPDIHIKTDPAECETIAQISDALPSSAASLPVHRNYQLQRRDEINHVWEENHNRENYGRQGMKTFRQKYEVESID
jgi:hypothetical protein